MKNGFIFSILDAVIKRLYYFNLVELFKFLAIKWFVKSKDDQEKSANVASIGIDIYLLLKWSFLALVWFGLETNHPVTLYAIYYLIGTNLFTYFDQHVWGGRYKRRKDIASIKRRFIKAIMAIAFYICCYAYLFEVHFCEQIDWPAQPNSLDALYMSICNSFTLIYGDFKPTTIHSRVLMITELINTFIFITIVIINSIPNPDKWKGD